MLSYSMFCVNGSPPEIDATKVLSHVVDGESFYTTMDERIRLADINTSGYAEPGY